jgi:hypothetical protein
MAEDHTWPGIREHGLLSTRALLDLFEIVGDERTRLYSQHRPESVEIVHALHGRAVIRDQKPMPESRLRPALRNGITAREWYELINDRVFFWVSEHRLLRLLSARAYRDRVHTVLHVDTQRVVTDYRDRIKLTAINSGNTLPIARPRGLNTFLAIEAYPFEEIRRKRKVADAVAELSVKYSVPNVAEYITRVERRKADTLVEVVWE